MSTESNNVLGPKIQSISDEEQREIFRIIDEQQIRRIKDEDEAAIKTLKEKVIPTPVEIRNIINGRTITSRTELIVHHSFWREKKLREGLDALFSTVHTAFVDVCRHEAALTSFSLGRKGFHEHVQHTVANPFQKDVMAYCAASIGVIDTVRRIASRRPDLSDKIDELVQGIFANDLTAFIKDLRNNLAHGSVIVPGWTIQSDGLKTTGAMTFEAKDILRLGDWSAASKRFIRDAADGQISIGQTFTLHHKMIQDFSKGMDDLFARHVTASEKDYYDIQDAHRRAASGMWANVIVSQLAVGKDPYDYLHIMFKPQEVREILRLPRHSKQQVDFIISLKTIETECDDNLRNRIYALFQVSKDDEG